MFIHLHYICFSESKSTDSFAVSPVKGQVSAQSPLSTVSSGFSSRRSSADNIGSTDGMLIQIHQLILCYSLFQFVMHYNLKETNK